MAEEVVDISIAPVVEPDAEEGYQVWGQTGSAVDAPVAQFPAESFAKQSVVVTLQTTVSTLASDLAEANAAIVTMQAQLDEINLFIDNGGFAPFPSLTAAPTITDPYVGQLTIATPGEYAGNPTVIREWLVNGVVAASDTVEFLPPEEGDSIVYREIATHGGDSLTTSTAAKVTGPAQSTAFLTNVAVTPEEGYAGSTFTVSWTTGGFPVPTVSVVWRDENGTLVPGETSPTFTPSAIGAAPYASYTADLTASNGVGADFEGSTDPILVYGPPVADGLLADSSTVRGYGPVDLPTADDFTGEGLVFSLDAGAAGVSIDPATGIVTSLHTTSFATTSIVVRATNDAGFATSSFDLTSQEVAPNNITPPSISGTGRIGDQLTAADGVWEGSLPMTFARVWRKNGTAIPGETGTTYAPVSGDDVSSIDVLVTADNGAQASEASNAVAITYTPPVAAGGLADVSDSAGTVVTVDASVDFTGENLTYGVVVGGSLASVDPATGEVDIFSSTPAAGSVVVRAENSGGFADTGFSVALSDPSSVMSSVSLSVTSAQPGAHVIAEPVYADGSPPQGDEVYQWKRNGVAMLYETWDTYVVRPEDVGDDITCSISSAIAGGAATSAALTLTDPAYVSGATNPAGLSAALAAASPGDTIWLGAGNYGYLDRNDLNFAGPVYLRSSDPDDHAFFEKIRLRGVSKNIVFRDIDITLVPTTDTKDFWRTFEVKEATCGYITWMGGTAQSGNNINPTQPSLAGSGVGYCFVADTRSHHVYVSDILFDTWRVPFHNSGSDFVDFRHNAIRNSSKDGVRINSVKDLRVIGNTIGAFFKNADDSSHPDSIQITTVNATRKNSDLVIADNILHSTDTTWTQSMFLSADSGATAEFIGAGLTIRNNLVYNGHLHGITVVDWDDILIENNTVIRNAATPTVLSSVAEPWIRLTESATNAVVTKNVVTDGPFDLNGTNTLVDNYTSTFAGTGAGTLAGDFAAIPPGGNATLAQLQPGATITSGGYGATYRANGLWEPWEAGPLAAPTVASVVISPSSGDTDDTYTATVTGTGSPTPTTSYQWKLDGVNEGTNSPTHTPSGAGTLTCVGTLTNSEGSDSLTSSGVTVAAAGPGFTFEDSFIGTANEQITVRTPPTTGYAISGTATKWQPWFGLTNTFELDGAGNALPRGDVISLDGRGQSRTARFHGGVGSETDGTLEAVVDAAAANRVIVIVAASSATEFSFVKLRDQDNSLEYIEVTGGVETVVTNVASPDNVGEFTVRVEKTGRNIEVFFDNVSVLTSASTTYTQGNYWGLGGELNLPIWKSVTFKPQVV